MAWRAPLLALAAEEAEEAAWSERLAAALGGLGGARAVELAEALGPWLTGEDDAARARATSALAEARVALWGAALLPVWRLSPFSCGPCSALQLGTLWHQSPANLLVSLPPLFPLYPARCWRRRRAWRAARARCGTWHSSSPHG